jgi:5-formyltetrahydrofolate cyclo-ligase
MDCKQQKIELRRRVLEETAALSDGYIAQSNAKLLPGVTSLEEFIAAKIIMLYCSVKREPETWHIVQAALSAGKTVAFPYCYRGGIMEARSISHLSELRPAVLGIPAPPDDAPVIAPDELDLIVVPALTYDKAGYRLGYGGGYYDRYLHGIRAVTVGLVRERLIKENLPVEPHDIAVCHVVTEDGVYSG